MLDKLDYPVIELTEMPLMLNIKDSVSLTLKPLSDKILMQNTDVSPLVEERTNMAFEYINKVVDDDSNKSIPTKHIVTLSELVPWIKFHYPKYYNIKSLLCGMRMKGNNHKNMINNCSVLIDRDYKYFYKYKDDIGMSRLVVLFSSVKKSPPTHVGIYHIRGMFHPITRLKLPNITPYHNITSIEYLLGDIDSIYPINVPYLVQHIACEIPRNNIQ